MIKNLIMNQNSTFAHLLGTDEYGRYPFSYYLWLPDSLSVGIISQAIALCHFYCGMDTGRWVEVVSFIQVFSASILAFAIDYSFQVMGPGLINLYIALGLLMWTTTARLIRRRRSCAWLNSNTYSVLYFCLW